MVSTKAVETELQISKEIDDGLTFQPFARGHVRPKRLSVPNPTCALVPSETQNFDPPGTN